VKTQDEVQRAHDLLWGIITGDVRSFSIAPSERQLLHAVLDCLCWILEHEHNQAFQENMTRLEKHLQEAGYRLRK
jgi:hypothetical protein